MPDLYNWSWVENEAAQTMAVWEECAARPWLGEPRFTPSDQRKREKAYDDGLRAVERKARKAQKGPGSRAARLEAQRRVVAVFPRFAAIALGLESEAVALLTDGFLPVATELARWARRFDPALSMADLIQACRNAWTACGLQTLLGEPMRLTPAILGYSLLYPYSDNYLDQTGVSTAEKLAFSARFRERLQGRRLAVRNPREAAIWAAVQLIEGEFPRLRFPHVYECLLGIHRAQELSIAQLKGSGDCDVRDLLRISCAKGGASVLADACLVRGWLSEEESRLAFEWGALLQLGDDLQDVREDLERGSASLFSRAAATGKPLDELVMQLLSFSDRVTARMERLPNGSSALKELLRMSWRNLILMAVAGTKEYFSNSFFAELEANSPFRFDFLRSRSKKLMGRKGMYQMLFDAFLEAGEGDLDRLPLAGEWMELCGENKPDRFSDLGALSGMLA
jgi:hypothetical protein